MEAIDVINNLLVNMEQECDTIKSGVLDGGQIRGINQHRKNQINYVEQVLKAKRMLSVKDGGIFQNLLTAKTEPEAK